jgi:small-conductance mechanosensitive channel
VSLTYEQIRTIYLDSGFTIKEGLTDLKPYVYASARAIESAACAERDKRIAELEESIDRISANYSAVDRLVTRQRERIAELKQQAIERTVHNNMLAESQELRIIALERELEAVRKDAERYRWLTTGDKVYSRFREAYDAWDGSDAKTGFDAAIDAAKEKP